MTVTNRYIAPDLSPWQGRKDAPPQSSLFQIVRPLDLMSTKSLQIAAPAFAILGFCSDEGVRRNQGRLGAAAAPQAVRTLLARLPLHRQGVTLFDAGDVTCTDSDLETSQQALATCVSKLHGLGLTPLVIGGGHEVAYGHYLGCSAAFPNRAIGVTNIDAHLDMRPLIDGQKGSSGTPFLQISQHCQNSKLEFIYNCVGAQLAGNTAALWETAKQHHARIITADQLEPAPTTEAQRLLSTLLDRSEINYLTICLDAFNSAYAPGVSAPQPFGFSPWTLLPWLRQWAKSGRIRSYDIAELCPPLDQDQRTARLAAQLLFEIIHHHAAPSS